MAAHVEIADLSLFRLDPVIPPARVHVGEIALFRVPAAGPAPKVHVSDIWITRGFEPPVVPAGGVRARDGSTWDSYGARIRMNGVWV
ncbi:hypothetical protein C1I92_09905 [Jiangella anatolica]|uniref:Uncharacterized protein n=1 Tax=Jiangella anatolica TaxID=2670374 RepID=A0A2W2BUU2_9ACTN|nr:hypothetical protein C1I92_09905 [Jiangella anatolica]